MKNIVYLMYCIFISNSYAFDFNPYAAESAIYKVEIKNCNTIFIGTGTLIARDKILTNCHVVNHIGIFSVMHQQSKQIFPTASYYNLGKYDACVLTGHFTKGKPVLLSTAFKIGETVWHFGYPRNSYGFGQGPIMGLIDTDQGMVIESGSFCNPGSSGGPLLNVKGNLIGLNFGVKSVGTQNKCLSIPVSNSIPFLVN